MANMDDKADKAIHSYHWTSPGCGHKVLLSTDPEKDLAVTESMLDFLNLPEPGRPANLYKTYTHPDNREYLRNRNPNASLAHLDTPFEQHRYQQYEYGGFVLNRNPNSLATDLMHPEMNYGRNLNPHVANINAKVLGSIHMPPEMSSFDIGWPVNNPQCPHCKRAEAENEFHEAKEAMERAASNGEDWARDAKKLANAVARIKRAEHPMPISTTPIRHPDDSALPQFAGQQSLNTGPTRGHPDNFDSRRLNFMPTSDPTGSTSRFEYSHGAGPGSEFSSLNARNTPSSQYERQYISPASAGRGRFMQDITPTPVGQNLNLDSAVDADHSLAAVVNRKNFANTHTQSPSIGSAAKLLSTPRATFSGGAGPANAPTQPRSQRAFTLATAGTGISISRGGTNLTSGAFEQVAEMPTTTPSPKVDISRSSGDGVSTSTGKPLAKGVITRPAQKTPSSSPTSSPKKAAAIYMQTTLPSKKPARQSRAIPIVNPQSRQQQQQQSPQLSKSYNNSLKGKQHQAAVPTIMPGSPKRKQRQQTAVISKHSGIKSNEGFGGRQGNNNEGDSDNGMDGGVPIV